LAEIGRIYKTALILNYLDDEALRRRMGRELNKGERSHGLSRFLCFGKEGTLRGREFEDQLPTFSALSVLHNAVVGWNTLQMGLLVEQLRQEGHTIGDDDLRHCTPLSHMRHLHSL
jgi:TnpA family transposase